MAFYAQLYAVAGGIRRPQKPFGATTAVVALELRALRLRLRPQISGPAPPSGEHTTATHRWQRHQDAADEDG